MIRRYNLRRIKSHLAYTASELAVACGVTIFTVRRWTAEGLRPIDGHRPYLFAPADIVAFLQKRTPPRQPLLPGEIFCVACKGPRHPLDNVADLEPRTATSSDLVGKCPDCGRRMFRRVRLAELGEKSGTLEVRYQDETVPIGNNGNAPHTTPIEEAIP